MLLRVLLCLALALPAAHAGSLSTTAPTRPVAGGGEQVVLEEVAVAVPPVEGEEIGDAPAPSGSGDADLAVTADAVVGEQVVTDVVESRGFQVLGLTWPDGADVDALGAEVRVRTGEEWSEWVAVEPADDGPDAGSPDARSSVRAGTDPVFVGEADAVQARFAATPEGGPQGLALTLIDSERPAAAADDGPSLPPAVSALAPAGVTARTVASTAAAPTRVSGIPAVLPALAGRPAIVTRAGWGADESLRSVHAGCETPSYASTLVGAAIHHTATANTYSSAAAAQSALRGIQAYHVLGRGWCDIGYNFLVDKWGTIYEGRAGGVDKAVIGVHTGGFNTRTVGVSMLGDYSALAPSAAMREAVARIVAWRLGAYHRDPTGTMTYFTYGGENSKIPANTSLRLPVVFPHGQVAYTSCPGAAGLAALPWIRSRARQLVGTNLVNPGFADSAVGVGSGAQLWSGAWGSVSWNLRMTNQGGATVWSASGAVTNGTIHARWSGRDSRGVPHPAGTYTLTLTGTDRANGTALVPYTTTLSVVRPVDPFGAVDAVTTAPGTIRVSGWAIDPDTSSPIMVQAFVDGRTHTTGMADRSRPDVAAVYPASGADHGYSLTLPASAGTRTVCVYGINTGPGKSVQLGCRSAVVPSSSPFGQVDAVRGATGRVVASGWAIDADTTGPVLVQMYLDGRSYTMGWANRRRGDVGAVYPWAGADHGYELSIAASRGTHTACVYAVNTGPGRSVQLGCRQVAVP